MKTRIGFLFFVAAILIPVFSYCQDWAAAFQSFNVGLQNGIMQGAAISQAQSLRDQAESSRRMADAQERMATPIQGGNVSAPRPETHYLTAEPSSKADVANQSNRLSSGISDRAALIGDFLTMVRDTPYLSAFFHNPMFMESYVLAIEEMGNGQFPETQLKYAGLWTVWQAIVTSPAFRMRSHEEQLKIGENYFENTVRPAFSDAEMTSDIKRDPEVWKAFWMSQIPAVAPTKMAAKKSK